jgi:hypothetical protein
MAAAIHNNGMEIWENLATRLRLKIIKIINSYSMELHILYLFVPFNFLYKI